VPARAGSSARRVRIASLAWSASVVFLWLLVASSNFAQASMRLPDGRVWEMVSPLDKNGGDIVGSGQISGGGIAEAAANGEAVTYVGESSFAEPQSALANQYLSSRHGTDGWSTQSIGAPVISGSMGLSGRGLPYKAFSSDMSLGLMLNGIPTFEEVPVENPPLTRDAPAGYQNFYRRGVDGSLQALLTSTPPQPVQGFYMILEGASPNLQHIVIASDGTLTPGSVFKAYRPNLYEWTDGVWQAVNIMPEASGGETTPRATLGSEEGGESHMVSDNGARIFWSNDLRQAPALFVRDEGTRTLQLDAPRGGQALSGEIKTTIFQTASDDGSLAFFTSTSPLTSDANTGTPCSGCLRRGADLYQFNVNNDTLRDLTPDQNSGDANGAGVHGVLGASGDGTYVYFVASGTLAGPNPEGRSPIGGGDNLYVWHEAPGKSPIQFVGSLSETDASDWDRQILVRTARVAPSGETVVFESSESLTGYDTRDAESGIRDEEVYLYDAASKQLHCASCNPRGARPLGPSRIPAGASFEQRQYGGALYEPRALSDDGSRVFFDSMDEIVPQDTNSAQDVYEYEGGKVYLLSGGKGAEGAEFVDASADGSDVFFLTRDELVHGDNDQLTDLYDARIGGGIAEPLAPTAPCQGEECKPEASPQLQFAPRGSAVFSGAGNITPPAVTAHVKPKPKSKPKLKRKTRHRRRTIFRAKHRAHSRRRS
jgi:hypothetical protein